MMPIQLQRIDRLLNGGESTQQEKMYRTLGASDLIKHLISSEGLEDNNLSEMIFRALYELDIVTLDALFTDVHFQRVQAATLYTLKNCKNLNKYISVRAAIKRAIANA